MARGRGVIAGLAMCVAGVLSAGIACTRQPSAPKNVLLITLDTLRADRVGTYGYAAAATPVLDALAARGARFAQATTTTPLTLAAHTSLFTGTWPMAHGVRDNTGFYVEDRVQTLAETLKARGFRTAGFVGAFVLDRRWGIGQGFDTYFDDFDLSEDVGPGLDAIQRPGSEVVDRALAWLGQDDDQPFFGWVHLYDPHTPYAPPAEFARRFPATRDGAYDAEIAYTDAQVGRLLAALESAGRLDDTLVVVLADHGEQLGEHQEQSHGFFVYDASVQIPFIVAGPGVAARVVPDQVRIIDVMPTVLDLLGVPAPPDVQGTSLRPALAGQRQELLAFSESWFPRFHYGWSEVQAVRDGAFKFILAPTRELYDVAKEPGERTNLAATDQDRADRMERALRTLVAQATRADAVKGPQAIDPAAEQRLRALGYVGSTSARHLDDRPRRDPKDAIALYNLLLQAGQDSEAGRYDAALAKVNDALAVDADILEGYSRLGNIHTKAGRHDQAIAAYRKALAIDPDHLMSTFNLALAYRTAGKIDEAIVGFERVRQLDPRSGRGNFQLGDIYMQRGDHAKAVAVLTEGLGLDIDRPPFLVKLAEAHLALEQYDRAEPLLKEAVALRPHVPRGQYDLGLVLEKRGRAAEARAAFEAEAASNPSHSGAPFTLGQMLQKEGRHAEAIQRFKAAIAAQSGFAEAHLYLAKSLLDVGDLAGAEQAARDGLQRKPARGIAPLGHYVLADVYSRQGRENEAARQVALAQALERGTR